MKKMIEKFIALDTTRKLVITFVCISFLSILLITVMNLCNANFPLEEKRIVINEKGAKKNHTKKIDDDKKEKNAATNDSLKQNQDENQTTIKQHANTNDSSTIQNSDNANTNVPNVEMVSASISIVGLNDELLASGNVSVEKGQSVYTGLQKFANEKGLTITVNQPGKYAYITSIAGLYEKQHGATSGWLYQVNGVTLNLGCGHVKINQDDQIIWYYSYD